MVVPNEKNELVLTRTVTRQSLHGLQEAEQGDP